MKRSLLAITLLLASWPAVLRGEPQSPPPRVRLAYRAVDGCPTEDAFVAAVSAQTRAFQRAPRSAARIRSLDATIARRGDGFRGLLRVREAEGTTSERDMTGSTCDEVFSALTLVAAITIDTGPPPPSPPPPEPVSPPPPPQPRPLIIATALSGGAFFSMAKDPVWGLVPALEIASTAGGIPVGLQLGGALAVSPRASTTAGSAEFLWIAGRASGSVQALSISWFSLHPTAGVDAGILRGRGFDLAAPRMELRPWADLAAGVRAELMAWPPAGIEVSAGMLIPLTRGRWVFEDPDQIVHETPPVGAYFTLGLRAELHRRK